MTARQAVFPDASEADWLALVTRTLKERPVESLRGATSEGLAIAPLYTATRSEPQPRRAFDAERAWDIRTITAHPDVSGAKAEIMADLQGGASSVVLRIDPKGERGVAIGSADDLRRALDGVILELAPVALEAGYLGVRAAEWLGSAAKASPGARLSFHLDPLGTLAATGSSPGPVESHIIAGATTAARLGEAYPLAQLFLASGRVIHEAGGGEALEVAFAAACAVAYARAMVRAGMPIAEAFARITLGLTADADYFLTIAKLRAARRVWAQIAAACGAGTTARIEARSSQRMLAAQDAWTNMIRITAAGFGAAVGGADAITLGAFTDPLGRPTAFARRQSRNAQLILMEEAHVGRVADPAAGSGYVEALTDEIARTAWGRFQTIEAGGGIIRALTEGEIAAAVDATRAARTTPRMVGVNVFPPATDDPVEVLEAEIRPVDAPSPRLPGPESACPPLTAARLSQPFEAGN